jgi:hypothetical protein
VKLSIPESPVKRMAAAIGAVVAIMVAAGFIYLLSSNDVSSEKVNAPRIVAAAHAYTRQLVAAKQPIPGTVSINELLGRGYLKPADVGPFLSLDAVIILTSDASNPRAALMRVRMKDGTDFLLFNDGSTQQITR